MSAAIVKSEPSILDMLVTPEWPRAVIDILKRQVCPKGISDDHFYVFMKKCQVTGMNPLVGEAFCVPRNTKGPDGQAITMHVFETSAEGMRSRAGRFPDFLAVDGGAVYANDKADINQGEGVVKHSFNAAADRGAIRGAWGRVRKKDGTAVVAWLPVGSRQASGPVWSKDPGGHLAKCAMVQALRLAYPVTFADTYIREEMQEEKPTRAESVLSTAQVVDVAPAPPPPSTGPVCEFGPWKGRPISEMSEQEVRDAIAHASEQVEKFPNMAAKARAKLDACVALLREAYPEVPALSEPSTPAVVLEARPVSHAMIDLQEEPTDEQLAAERAARAKREPGSEG